MKEAVKDSTVLAVMNLFDNEKYYKHTFEVLWVLRDIVLKKIECNMPGARTYNIKHPDFWLAEVTNEIIGRLIIDGYTYSTLGLPHWYDGKPRDEKECFLSYKEARFLAGIANDEALMKSLYRLRDAVTCFSEDPANPLYSIYRVTSDLLGVLAGFEELEDDKTEARVLAMGPASLCPVRVDVLASYAAVRLDTEPALPK